MAEYKVQFEVFEGPLDLLLYLIKKEEVDIYEINLTQLATRFIEYVEMMRMLDLEIAGEFLVMAATLMYIKSRELLPKEQQVENPEEEEGEDPLREVDPPAPSSSIRNSRTPPRNCRRENGSRAEDVPAPAHPRLEMPEPEAPRRAEASIFDPHQRRPGSPQARQQARGYAENTSRTSNGQSAKRSRIY